jgi:hypothetical protein
VVKPSINALSQVFHDLNRNVRGVLAARTSNGDRLSLKEQEDRIDEIYSNLRKQLEEWGIAEKIDWDVE